MAVPEVGRNNTMEPTMRAEIEAITQEIEQAIDLLRRHL